VGAARETDLDILRTVDWVYRELSVFRAYYSAYQHVGGVPEASARSPDVRNASGANPLLREHRLYQVDFLLRGYGFRFEDIVFDGSGNVPREVDPKTAYAMMHPELYPVDVNRAAETDLLRVPGIGPVTARRVVEARRERPFGDLADLRKLGGVARRAGRYLRFAGRASDEQRHQWKQLDLIDEIGQGWRTRLDPLDKDRIRPGRDGSRYQYTGQTGRRLHYATGGTSLVVRCR
jgi:predicted DNA-binding helix-hairpin-helix protein